MKKLHHITWLRTLSTLSILCCHLVPHSSSALLNMSAQFWNIGVQIFFIISAMLAAAVDFEKDVFRWYKKRLKRIYTAWIPFVLVLFCVHATIGKNLLDLDWIWLALGLQGTIVGVQGAEQTWFISALLLCYLITPIASKCRKAWIRGLWFVIPAVVACFDISPLSTISSCACFYILALTSETIRKPLEKRKLLLAILAVCGLFAVRVIVRAFADGTILYDGIVAGYTHWLAAYLLVRLGTTVFSERKPWKCVQTINDLSFEIYLYHYMLIVGPISLMGLTPFWLTDCVLVAIVTLCAAWVAKRFAEKLSVRLN